MVEGRGEWVEGYAGGGELSYLPIDRYPLYMAVQAFGDQFGT
jgi:hypothetical protein